MKDRSKSSYLSMEEHSLSSLHKILAEIIDARDVSNLNVCLRNKVTNISFVRIPRNIQRIFKKPLLQKNPYLNVIRCVEPFHRALHELTFNL